MALLSAPIFIQSVALILELLHCSNSTLLGIKIANVFRNYLCSKIDKCKTIIYKILILRDCYDYSFACYYLILISVKTNIRDILLYIKENFN